MQAVYLNQAGTTWPKPEPVRQAIAAALAAEPGDWSEQFRQGHERLCEFWGVTDRDRLLLTPGCTSALAVAVADHPWQRGDRVLTSGLEHHALARPLQKLAELDVQVERLPYLPGEPLDLEALEKALRRGGVRMVAVTAASNVTGELLPIEQIVSLSHQYEAKVLIDAAQVAGWWKIDLKQLGADLVAFGGHKGLHGPWGLGGLYVHPELAMQSPAASCEIPAAQGSLGESAKHGCAVMPGYCDVGSVDRVALAGVQAALDWLEEPKRARRLEEAREGIAQFTDAIQGLPGVRLLGDRRPEKRLPILAFQVAKSSPSEVSQMMMKCGVIVASGLQCAPEAHATLGTAPHGVVRLSVGPMNDRSQIEMAAERLRQVLRAR